MASWRHTFLFSRGLDKLTPAGAIHHLGALGLELDDRIRMCVPIDEDGHLLDVGDEVPLDHPAARDLARHLQEGESFSIEARNAEVVLACHFLVGAPNPHIVLGWSNRLFAGLDPGRQEAYRSMARRFGRDCGAAYAISVDDAPDQFADQFIEIDGRAFLETRADHGYGHGLREVWVNKALAASPPEGPVYTHSIDVGDGFVAFFVEHGKKRGI